MAGAAERGLLREFWSLGFSARKNKAKCRNQDRKQKHNSSSSKRAWMVFSKAWNLGVRVFRHKNWDSLGSEPEGLLGLLLELAHRFLGVV